MYTRLAIGYLGASAVFGLASHETLAEAAALVTGPGRIPAAVGRRAGCDHRENPRFVFRHAASGRGGRRHYPHFMNKIAQS
jgi:hypothetical protein